MKVLIYNSDFCHKTQTFIYNEILGVNESCEVLVVCHKRINAQQFPFDNLQLIQLPKPSLFQKVRFQFVKLGLSYNVTDKSLKSEFSKCVKEFGPDIIHLHFGTDALLFLDNIDPLPKVPIFISYHGYDASRMLKENKAYLNKLKANHKKEHIFPIVVSLNMLKRLKRYKVPMFNHRLLYYGANTDFFKRQNRIKGVKIKILQVSSFREKKGHQYTLEAFSKFLSLTGRRDVELILAGDGPLLNSIKALVDKLELNDYVRFPGFVSVQETRDYMDSANVFVHHSITAENGDKEGIPNAIIEAMSMELPVLSTLHSGIPELVENGVNGFLVNEKDIDTYARKMVEIIDWNYQKVNRVKVVEKFSLINHSRLLLEYYKQAQSA